MLLELKPSYTVVGDVTQGPQLFKSGCWRLIEELRPADVPKAENGSGVQPAVDSSELRVICSTRS